MADLSDVQDAIAALILGVVYPNGTSSPSVVNADVRIFPGWPNPADLDSDLGVGKVNISIYSQPGVERNTTRYPREEVEIAAPATTITATVNGNQITLGGTVTVPQNVVVICGSKVAFPYGVVANDTLTSIAAALAALIAAAFPGTSSAGPVITIGGAPGIVKARVGGVGQIWIEERRQQKGFMVTLWCSTPTQRKTLAPIVDGLFAKTDWLNFADGSAGRMIYSSTRDSDEGQKVRIYRRDLMYSVEYPTASLTPAAQIEAVGLTVRGGQSPDGTNDSVPINANPTYI